MIMSLNARQLFVDVHRVQQRLIVTSLKLVGTDQEPVRVLLDLFGDPITWETAHLAFRYHLTFGIRFPRECDNGFVRALDLF